MSPHLLLVLIAFGASLVFAIILNEWRQRFRAGVQPDDPSPEALPLPSVTLLIPVRDGAGTLAALLQDLHAQQYPKERMEVLVVDDHSGDGTVAVVESMRPRWPQLRILANAGEGKKAAITTGVKAARHGSIILTDADGRCGPTRVRRVVQRMADGPLDMLLLPVSTEHDGSFWQRVQADEQAGLMAVAAASAFSGSPLLANGANLAFERSAFEAVGGYEGDRYASGDDLFLLERMRRAGKRIGYLLDRGALVSVKAENGFRGFWQQRVRWAGKMRGVRGAGKWVVAGALLLPWALLVLSCAFAWPALVNQGWSRAVVLTGTAWVCWLVPAVSLVTEARAFLGRPPSMVMTSIAFLAFTLYAPLIAAASFLLPVRWKGRLVR